MNYAEDQNVLNLVVSREELLQETFSFIVSHYDFGCNLLSLGLQKFWKKRLVKIIAPKENEIILDVGCGTADIPILISENFPKIVIYGVDINKEMLDAGRAKINSLPITNVELKEASVYNLPWPCDYFDAISIAFVLRNIDDQKKALAEIYRVLKPGGRLVSLGFFMPPKSIIRPVVEFWLFKAVPFLGKLIAKNKIHYEYLSESIRCNIHPKNRVKLFSEMGFKRIKYYQSVLPYAIHIAFKNKS
ncbi:MAG: ubiquinone/menaquinone biosynthesis methyltransferase [Patescibacteria group bacterium]